MRSQAQSGAPRVTLRDVGLAAGIDPSLVSRILNGDPKISVPASTRDRVVAAAASLRYRPNHAARALATARTSSIAFHLPEVSNPIYGPILAGAQRRATERDHVLLVAEIGQGHEEQVGALGAFDGRQVDGRLLASGTIDDRSVRKLITDGPPAVVVNRWVPRVECCVITDDAAGAALAAEHLVDLGHRRLAVITGPQGVDTSRRRVEGFGAYVRESRRAAPIVLEAGGWTARHGYAIGRDILRSRRSFTGLFACSAMLAVGVLRAANELGVGVPGEMSVVALHEFEFADYTWPALTTVAMPMDELGAASVDQLLTLIAGEKPKRVLTITTPPELVLRNSTAPIGR